MAAKREVFVVEWKASNGKHWMASSNASASKRTADYLLARETGIGGRNRIQAGPLHARAHSQEEEMSKLFVLYDGRAKFMDTDDATVMDTAESVAEARATSENWRDHDAVWFEYNVQHEGDTEVLHDETMRADIGKGILLA
jgi:hypothetical protein